jgi:hypothetical protein
MFCNRFFGFLPAHVLALLFDAGRQRGEALRVACFALPNYQGSPTVDETAKQQRL